MSLPGDIPCLTPCQNISCPYCAFGACMDNTHAMIGRRKEARSET